MKAGHQKTEKKRVLSLAYMQILYFPIWKVESCLRHAICVWRTTFKAFLFSLEITKTIFETDITDIKGRE